MEAHTLRFVVRTTTAYATLRQSQIQTSFSAMLNDADWAESKKTFGPIKKRLGIESEAL
jgi:hypothetical protein